MTSGKKPKTNGYRNYLTISFVNLDYRYEITNQIEAVMAIYIKASNQQVLQDAIIKAIHSKKIENWIMTANHYITQNSDLYALRAGFIPHVENNNLIFGILISKNEETKRELYALYHGQFTEMLIKNFYQYFSCIAITSSPEEKYDTPYILDDSLTNLNNLSSCYDS